MSQKKIVCLKNLGEGGQKAKLVVGEKKKQKH